MGQLTLVIGNKNYSSWSLRPWLWMKQSGIPFEELNISLNPHTLERDLSPYFSNSKVPLLLDGDEQIWDSLAIMEYLAESYPDQAWPGDRLARAKARAVVAEMHSSFFAMRNKMPLNCRKRFVGYKPEEDTLEDIERIVSIWQQCRKEYSPDGPWLFGGFTIADAFYAPVALRFRSYGVELTGEAADYMAALLSNPYVEQWVSEGVVQKEIIDWVEIDPSKYSEVIEVKK